MLLHSSVRMTVLAAFLVSTSASAEPIVSKSRNISPPSFDIQSASITREASNLVFRMTVADGAGKSLPRSIGKLKGAEVYSYVWPTSLDPSAVGFSRKAGLLAFAVTSHPDFDDTPLFDEDGDGDPTNDGRIWHSHWVVLAKTAKCGKSGLKVRDIGKGETFDLPKTWPNLPILIDSPGWHPRFTRTSIEVRVPFEKTIALKGVSFDGVTAALRVNANAHSPLLCVTATIDVASGKLTMPGKVD